MHRINSTFCLSISYPSKTLSHLHSHYAVNKKKFYLVKVFKSKTFQFCEGKFVRRVCSVYSFSIMANSTWHVYGTIFVYLVMCFVCQNVITQTDSRPWYESLPAVAMDYKVHIDAGKEDCYYQYVQPGATFYVSFQVNNFFGIFVLDLF